MNFYQTKYVSCKKTESGRHTRCSRGRGAPTTLVGPSCPSRTATYFFYFSKYSKTEKYCLRNCFGVGLLTVLHTYSFLESETVWEVSLMYSSGVTVSITLVSTFYGVTWDVMFDSLTVYHLRICACKVVDFYGTGAIDFLDNVRTFPFGEKFSCKKLKRELYSNT